MQHQSLACWVSHGKAKRVLMEELDSERIVEDVVDILALEALPEISANCRQLTEQEYSFDASVDRYRRILQELS